jgi:hypothetical protein
MKNILSALFLLTLCATAQPQSRAEILILGTYHMANPGHDIYNMHADDVLSPQRQQEIAALMEVLKKFRPTKIAVESDATSDRVPKEYADYLAGKYSLSRNEIDQIGYRLGKELGLKTIYPVDADGDFPIKRVQNYAKANNLSDKLDAVMSGWAALVKEQDEYLRSHTVLETLEYTNSDARVAKDVGFYMQMTRLGEPWEEAGPDLLAAWYQRNIRIYSNIVKLIDSPSDRILVIYGAGHLGWLRQDVAGDQTVILRKLSDFTGR